MPRDVRARRLLNRLITTGLLWSSIACAQEQSAAQILQRNYIACGGAAWQGKSTLKEEFSFSGQGLAGTASSIFDLRTGAFVESYDTPPVGGADGFDGAHAWMKEMSGTITPEAGGDKLQLAINEAYRNANAWWRPDRGGARIDMAPSVRADEKTFDVLEVAPRDGKSFQGWFDPQTALLARVVEKQAFQTITTIYKDYRRIDGVLIAGTVVIDDGSGPAGLQTLTLETATFLPAQPESYYARQPSVPNDFSIEGGANETTVPFELLNNHIYVPVFVDAKGPFRFIFDTGGHDILVPHTAKALGLKVVGQTPSFGAGEGSTESGFTRITELRIGAARLSNQVVGVEQFQPAAVEGFDQDGMIGFEVLRRFVVHIDYRNNKLTLTKPSAFHRICPDAGIPFVFNDHLPQVQGAFLELPGAFDLDTGSRVSLTLTTPFVDAHRLRERFPAGVVAVDGWGVGGPTKSYVIRAPQVRLGSLVIPDVVTSFALGKKGAFADPSYQGNVGTALLKRFDVTFHYADQIVYLQPLVAPVPDIAMFDHSGMWINGEDVHFTVMDVSPGGPAAEAGLKPGDEIVAVNGAPVNALKLSEFRQMLRDSPAGTVVKLTLKRGDATQPVVLTLRD